MAHAARNMAHTLTILMLWHFCWICNFFNLKSLKESIWSSKHAFNIVFNIVINIVCNMEACPENWKGCGQNSRTRNTSLISLFTWASCNKEVLSVDILYSMPFLSWKKTPDQATKSYILYMISYAMRYCGSTYDIVYRPTTLYVFAMTLYMHILCSTAL